jgi:hypothetical protein
MIGLAARSRKKIRPQPPSRKEIFPNIFAEIAGKPSSCVSAAGVARRNFCSSQHRKIHAGPNIVPNIGNIGDGDCGGPSAPGTHVDDKIDHTDLIDIVVRELAAAKEKAA